MNIINLIIPKGCLICQSTFIKDVGDPICLKCWKKVVFSTGPLCPICGRPFPSRISLSKSPNYICGLCREKRPYFQRHIYIGSYGGVLSKAIRLFKYKKKVSLAYSLSYLLCRKIKDLPEIDIIIPVPLYIKRLRSREFNQALLISGVLSLHLDRPVINNVMVKNRDTRPQVELNRQKRRVNIKDVFSITDRYLIKGKRVLLVDDVFTTGSTINECARILKKSGAYRIYAITLAMSNE